MMKFALPLICTLALLGCDFADSRRPSYATARGTLQPACPTSPAGALFAGGLCVCEDFDSVGDLIVRARAKGEKAHVGVNGVTNLVGTPRIEGSMVAFGGLAGVGEVKVSDNLSTTTSLEGVGTLEVGGDLSVGGNLSAVGQLQVGGAVRVAGVFAGVGGQKIGGLGPYQAPALPCGCGKAERFDVVAEVAKAKASHDNEKLGLPSLDLLGKADLKLGTGRYYFSGVRTLGETTIEITGAVAIYLEGNLDAVGTQNLKVGPGATLDLYVAGNIELVGDSDFGGEAGAVRIYVGGKDPVAVAVGTQAFRGSLYAPEAEVLFVGDTRVEGALFARTLTGVGTLEILEAGVSAPSPAMCGPEGGPAPEPVDGGASSEPAPVAIDGGASSEPAPVAIDGGAPGQVR